MEYLTAQDWTDFQRLYKEAFYFLLHRSLVRERMALSKAPDRLNDWQKRRLEQLNNLNDATEKGLDKP